MELLEKDKERKRLFSEILSRLETDLIACDVLVGLLNAAAFSIRHDSLVKPCPSCISITPDGHKDISQVVTQDSLSFSLSCT